MFVGAYAAAREEPIAVAAERLRQILRLAAAESPLFGGWRSQGRTRKAATAKPTISLDTTEDLERALKRGGHFTDIPRAPVPELGYRVSYWNGARSTDAMSIMYSCCSYTKILPLPNVLVLSIAPSLKEKFLPQRQDRERFLLSVLRILDAEWCLLANESSDVADCNPGRGAAIKAGFDRVKERPWFVDTTRVSETEYYIDGEDSSNPAA